MSVELLGTQGTSTDDSGPKCQKKKKRMGKKPDAMSIHRSARLIEHETRTFPIVATGVPGIDVLLVPGVLVDDVVYPLYIVKGR